MKEFTWKVLETNAAAGTMIVEYTYQGQVSTYNIPMPKVGQDLGEWVKAYAPAAEWDRMEQTLTVVEVGAEGTGTLNTKPPTPQAETPSVVGNWQEEYLRALIYQILEEIREAEQ